MVVVQFLVFFVYFHLCLVQVFSCLVQKISKLSVADCLLKTYVSEILMGSKYTDAVFSSLAEFYRNKTVCI